MTCNTCHRQMNYCFYINDEHWLKAVGKAEGYQCAHCILEKLGGLDWMIIWNEPTERIRMNIENTQTDGLEHEVKRGRGHTNYCTLGGDHEGDCPRPTEPIKHDDGNQSLPAPSIAGGKENGNDTDGRRIGGAT